MPPTSNTITVLVADDHELTRITLQLALSCQKNIQVVDVASNNQEAVEMLERYHPDIVVLDLEMSNIDDLSAAVHIKNIAPNTQIIAYSSTVDIGFQETGELDSFDAFCIKDISITELITIIKRLGQRSNTQFSVENFVNTALQSPKFSAETYNNQGDTMTQRPKKQSTFNLQGAQFGGGLIDAETVTANQIGGNITNYTTEQKQSLAEAAAEIQQLLC